MADCWSFGRAIFEDKKLYIVCGDTFRTSVANRRNKNLCIDLQGRGWNGLQRLLLSMDVDVYELLLLLLLLIYCYKKGSFNVLKEGLLSGCYCCVHKLDQPWPLIQKIRYFPKGTAQDAKSYKNLLFPVIFFIFSSLPLNIFWVFYHQKWA